MGHCAVIFVTGVWAERAQRDFFSISKCCAIFFYSEIIKNRKFTTGYCTNIKKITKFLEVLKKSIPSENFLDLQIFVGGSEGKE